MVAVIALLALALGCGSQPAQTDADGDGVPWPRDCDDADPGVHPGASETYDGRDEDCDGVVDEEVSVSAWYRDADGDGWGDADDRDYGCATPEGFVAEVGDCDDGDAAISPGAEDGDCDGVDQDCDGWDGNCLELGAAVVLHGSPARGEAGVAVAGVGDLDGDGYDDALIGAPTWGRPVTCHGAVWLLRGGPAPTGGDLANVAWLITGVDEDGWAGLAVSGAGDVDGDGVSDAIVSAPYAGTGATEAGAVYLLLGGPDFAPRDLSEADAAYLGVGDFERAGYALAGGGDVDGDGLDDLLIGVYGFGEGLSAVGGAYLVLGRAVSEDRSLVDADACLSGGQYQGHAGLAVAITGDTDGDGLDDLLIGAPDAYLGASFTGAAYYLRGRATQADLDLDAADALFTGLEESHAGTSVAGAGDVDGDGLADLLIGASGYRPHNLGALGAAM